MGKNIQLKNKLLKLVRLTFIRSRLRVQLISVLMAVSIIPMVVIGLFTYKNTIENIHKEKSNTMKAYSESVLSNLDNRIKTVEGLLRGMSNSWDVIGILKEINANMPQLDVIKYYSTQMALKNQVLNSEKIYETIFLTRANGVIVLDGSNYSNYYVDKEFYRKEDYESIMQSRDVYIGKPIKSIATGNILLPVSRGVISEGQFLGIITVMININNLTSNFNKMYFGGNCPIVRGI